MFRPGYTMKSNSSKLLKECSCCQKIKLPGENKARPFLQASEQKLFELLTNQNSILDIEDLFVFPEVITKIGDQEEHGFKAEYRVYEELKKLKLHTYMFYSPKMKKKELGDFLLISKTSVIIVEVKAFKLKDNRMKEDYEILQNKLLAYKKQEKRVIQDIKVFLTRHNCNYNADLFYYFIVFPNTKRSDIPKEIEWMPENVLFQEEYSKRLFQVFKTHKKLSLKELEPRFADENSQYTLRTLLAWCYGLYLSSSSQMNILSCLNDEYKRSKTNMEGIFLTPMQKLIVECDQPFLVITGMPGTGKTYCLILKVVRYFVDFLKLHRVHNQKGKELIVIYHRNEKTIRFIEEMFWRLVKKQIGQQRMNNMEEISKFIIFLHKEKRWGFDKGLLPRLKIFYDDLNLDIMGPISFEFGSEMNIISAMGLSEVFWCTTYRDINPFEIYRSLSNFLDIKTVYHRVYLTDGLRYTGSIQALLNQLHTKNIYRFGSAFYIQGFSPGTRIIGKKPQFVCVKNCRAMQIKVHELLQKLDKDGIKKDEIAVIKTESWTDLFRDDLIRDILIESAGRNDFQNEVTNLMRELDIYDHHLEIEDAHSINGFDEHVGSVSSRKDQAFSLRGMEFRYIILCVTQSPKFISKTILEQLEKKKFRHAFKCCATFFREGLIEIFRKWEMFRTPDLIEAISRAYEGAILVYTYGDVLLSQIEEDFKDASPEICTNNSYNQKYLAIDRIEKVTQNSVQNWNVFESMGIHPSI